VGFGVLLLETDAGNKPEQPVSQLGETNQSGDSGLMMMATLNQHPPVHQ